MLNDSFPFSIGTYFLTINITDGRAFFDSFLIALLGNLCYFASEKSIHEQT